jgi:hypothetical protein
MLTGFDAKRGQRQCLVGRAVPRRYGVAAFRCGLCECGTEQAGSKKCDVCHGRSDDSGLFGVSETLGHLHSDHFAAGRGHALCEHGGLHNHLATPYFLHPAAQLQ